MLTITIENRENTTYKPFNHFDWKKHENEELTLFVCPKRGCTRLTIQNGEVDKFEPRTTTNLFIMERIINQVNSRMSNYEDAVIEGYISDEEGGTFIAYAIQPMSGQIGTVTDQFDELESLGFQVPEYLTDTGLTEQFIRQELNRELGVEMEDGMVEYLTPSRQEKYTAKVKEIRYSMKTGKIDGLVAVIVLDEPKIYTKGDGQQVKIDRISIDKVSDLLVHDGYIKGASINFTYDETNGIEIG